jgi:hypothetical protein
MVAVTVTWNGTRIDAADSGSSTSNIGGGAGAGAEPDIVYQGSGATPEEISRKVGTSAAGFSIDSTITDISTATGTYQTLVMKYAAGNWAALETLATPGLEARLGSGTSAYAQYDFAGSDAYPEKGGFVFLCVDPNIAGYRTATIGSPNFASADYWGIVGDFTATSKSENLVHSSVDVGDGYTVTGGGGADPTADYADISAFNSTLANRHGFLFALEGQEGAYGQYGTVVWGSSATAVDYQDTSAPTVFLLDGFYEAGWSGIEDNLENASTVINPVGGTFISRGDTTTTDTRGVYNVVGSAATGTKKRTSQTFVNFAQFNAASVMTYEDCDIETADLAQNSATLTGCTIRCTALTGVATCNDADFTGLTNVTWVQAGAGHAVEITSPGTYTFDSQFFDGFGADGTNSAAIYNNSGGAVTINITGAGDTPTVRNGAGASTTINNAVSITLNDLVAGSTVYIFNSTDSVELFKVVEPTTTFTDSVNYTGDKTLLIRVRNHSGTPYYQDFSATGTLTSSGFTLNVNQILDE